MIEFFILITFILIFYFLYQKDKRDRQQMKDIVDRFYETHIDMLSTIEKTNDRFYEMASAIEIEHFKQLRSQSEASLKTFEETIDKLLIIVQKEKEENKVSRLDVSEPNSIEKIQEEEDPLMELNPADFANIKNVQFEGEEEIYPIE